MDRSTCPGPQGEPIPLFHFDDDCGGPAKLAVSVAPDGRSVFSVPTGPLDFAQIPVLLSVQDTLALARLLAPMLADTVDPTGDPTVDPTKTEADPASSTAGDCPFTLYRCTNRCTATGGQPQACNLDTYSVVDAIRDFCHQEP